MRGERTIFLDAAENVVHVVWEEALCIEHRLNEPRDRTERHLLGVRVTVPLNEDVTGGVRGSIDGRTSSRCFTFFTNMFPSAAKPFTASTARSVLGVRQRGRVRERVEETTHSRKTLGA